MEPVQFPIIRRSLASTVHPKCSSSATESNPATRIKQPREHLTFVSRLKWNAKPAARLKATSRSSSRSSSRPSSNPNLPTYLLTIHPILTRNDNTTVQQTASAITSAKNRYPTKSHHLYFHQHPAALPIYHASNTADIRLENKRHVYESCISRALIPIPKLFSHTSLRTVRSYKSRISRQTNQSLHPYVNTPAMPQSPSHKMSTDTHR
jgi:hypothetical protein